MKQTTKLKIEIFKEKNFYIATLKTKEGFDAGATQGKSLEELFFMIWDLIALQELELKRKVSDRVYKVKEKC